jgi:LPS-assembly lipoprotein
LPRRTVLAVIGLGLLAGGCFTPLYAERTPNTGVSTQLANVDVKTIEGRVGQQVRNALIFELGGGAGSSPLAPYRLEVDLTENTQSMTVDPTTGRATVELITLNATFRLQDVTEDRVVLKDRAFAQASIDRGAQIYARDRAKRDAENRAAKEVASRIRERLAAYFTAPTPPPPPSPADKTAGKKFGTH